MKTVLLSVTKNVILLFLALLALWYAFYRKISPGEMLITEFTLGTVYLLVSCYEFMNGSFRSHLPALRFGYFTDGLVSKHLLKFAVFGAAGVILLIAGNYLRHIGYVCFFIAFTDTVVLFLKNRMKLFFISLESDYVLVGGDATRKYFANEIDVIEFRHQIVYFVKKDKTDISIRVYVLKQKRAFVDQVLLWAKANHVTIGAESRQLLETYKGF